MRRFVFLFVSLVLAVSVNAQTIVVDNFESYSDDAAVQGNWVFSKAGGPDGVAAYLEKTGAAEGSQCMSMDVSMPERWWQNKLRKEIAEGPLDLSKYSTVELQFMGDAQATSDLVFSVFLYDSNNRVLKADIPSSYYTSAAWQKFSVSVNAFVDETWDDGYGSETPDAVHRYRGFGSDGDWQRSRSDRNI
jgi:hypothetical protein